MATLWIARWSSGCRSSSSGHVALFGVVEEHFWRWLEGRPRVLRPQRVFYSTWLSRPSTRCRTSCCWSRNTGVSDHVRVYTRCASSVWTLLFGVFVAVFASLSSAVRCCLLILGCCRAFSCGSLQIVVPWLLPSALHRFFGRCCSFGLFPWLLPCAFCAPVLWQMIGCSACLLRADGSCWLFLAVAVLLCRFYGRYLAVPLAVPARCFAPALADVGCSFGVLPCAFPARALSDIWLFSCCWRALCWQTVAVPWLLPCAFRAGSFWQIVGFFGCCCWLR